MRYLDRKQITQSGQSKGCWVLPDAREWVSERAVLAAFPKGLSESHTVAA